MKKQFEVGDCVAVYGVSIAKPGECELVRKVGTIAVRPHELADGLLPVQLAAWSGGQLVYAHEKQLRRLIPKPRRRWTVEACAGAAALAEHGPTLAPGETVEVIEVRKGKK